MKKMTFMSEIYIGDPQEMDLFVGPYLHKRNNPRFYT